MLSIWAYLVSSLVSLVNNIMVITLKQSSPSYAIPISKMSAITKAHATKPLRNFCTLRTLCGTTLDKCTTTCNLHVQTYKLAQKRGSSTREKAFEFPLKMNKVISINLWIYILPARWFYWRRVQFASWFIFFFFSFYINAFYADTMHIDYRNTSMECICRIRSAEFQQQKE